MSQTVGITAYGTYLPRWEVNVQTLADQLGFAGKFQELKKRVAEKDEDSFTMAVEAVRLIPDFGTIAPQAVYVGSESHAYAVKPTSVMLADAFDWQPYLFAADVEFACKAGTAAMQIVYAMVKAGLITSGLAVGVDKAIADKDDVLQLAVASGAAAYNVGAEKVIAQIKHTVSVATDLPDFWRHQGEATPNHAGRFTASPGYLNHVSLCVKKLLDNAGLNASDVDHFVFHHPNANLLPKLQKMLDLKSEQVATGYLFPQIGNTYSANSLIGLAAVLDTAMPGQTVALVSYGSGAGCDGFIFEITDEVIKYREHENFKSVQARLKQSQNLEVNDYLSWYHE